MGDVVLMSGVVDSISVGLSRLSSARLSEEFQFRQDFLPPEVPSLEQWATILHFFIAECGNQYNNNYAAQEVFSTSTFSGQVA